MMIKMKNILTIAIVLVFAACSGNEEGKQKTKEELLKAKMTTKKDRIETIDSLENVLFADSTSINRGAASFMIKAYKDFLEHHPDHQNAADYAYKGGEVAMALGRGHESLKFFQTVVDDYPEYDRYAYAMFMKAFVLENSLQDYKEAEVAYNRFLEEHPRHELAKDAEYSIKNLGKSPEELIKEFEEKNKKESREI